MIIPLHPSYNAPTSSPVHWFRYHWAYRLSITPFTTIVMTLTTKTIRRKNAIKYDAERAKAYAAANPSEATSTGPVVRKSRGRKPKAVHHKKRIRLAKKESARVAEESARVAATARAKLRGHSSDKLIPLPTKPSTPSNYVPTAARPKSHQPHR